MSSRVKQTAVCVSGGADSLLSLVRLHRVAQRDGGNVLAVHGLFLPDAEAGSPAVQGLRHNCETLGVDLEVLDLRTEFETCVVRAFERAYAAGQTPNPCALCNPRMKFGVLFDRVMEMGCDAIATGHYVRLAEHAGLGKLLTRGSDPQKDQSYFLSLVPLERLLRAQFPVGGQTKAETVAELEELGLRVPVPKESQDVCFVPGDDYRAFLLSRGTSLPGPGRMCLADGTEVGRHDGLWNYTQGQRRGLRVAWSEPLYVIDKDLRQNVLIVGPRDELASVGCRVREVNCMVDPSLWPRQVLVQTRYRQRAMPSDWRFECDEGDEGDELALEFAEPNNRPTPGQIATVYSAQGAVLGGGVIVGPLEA